MNKIFQIGFNKCGTVSFSDMFKKVKNPVIKTIHWDHGNLASTILHNLTNDLPLLTTYEDYKFFSDMEYFFIDQTGKYNYFFAPKLFKMFDHQYPNSKFILNIRDVNKWIDSRTNHKMCKWFDGKLLDTQSTYIEYHQLCYSLSEDAIKAKWKHDWYEHISNVKNYFKHRPNDLLVYDIEKDDMSKIKEFFKQDINFQIDKFPHSFRTK